MENIQPLELEGGKVVLDTHHDKLERFLPEDLADYSRPPPFAMLLKH